MKAFCLAIACCAGLVGTAGAQPVPAAPAAPNPAALSEEQKTAIASLRSESEKKATLVAVQLAEVVQ